MSFEDETVEFWLQKTHAELAQVAAVLHRDRREADSARGLHEVLAARRVVAEIFINGQGVEVGAGDRRWPLPDRARCFYGDVRDHEELRGYFKGDAVEFDGRIDAQTFRGVPDASLDFVIAGHVLEHLPDPIGAIRETCRVLREHGVFLLAVPDMRYTHDRARPETTHEHLLADEIDGGLGTIRQAYEEHVRYVHPLSQPPIPEELVDREVDAIMAASMDIHFHAWSGSTFAALLSAISVRLGFTVAAHVPVCNEDIFALRKTPPATDDC